MRFLYKTSDVVNWLYKWNCEGTAEGIKKLASGAEYLDSRLVKDSLLPELYKELDFELNKTTYTTKSTWDW